MCVAPISRWSCRRRESRRRRRPAEGTKPPRKSPGACRWASHWQSARSLLRPGRFFTSAPLTPLTSKPAAGSPARAPAHRPRWLPWPRSSLGGAGRTRPSGPVGGLAFPAPGWALMDSQVQRLAADINRTGLRMDFAEHRYPFVELARRPGRGQSAYATKRENSTRGAGSPNNQAAASPEQFFRTGKKAPSLAPATLRRTRPSLSGSVAQFSIEDAWSLPQSPDFPAKMVAPIFLVPARLGLVATARWIGGGRGERSVSPASMVPARMIEGRRGGGSLPYSLSGVVHRLQASLWAAPIPQR